MTKLNDRLVKLIAAAAVALFAQTAEAGGPFGIDHELALDQNGIWARKYQNALETGVVVQVPLFIEEGDLVRVDTRSGDYLTREK